MKEIIKVKVTGEIMAKAHRLTKQIKEENPSVDYRFQLGLCIKYCLQLERERIVFTLKPLTMRDINERSVRHTEHWKFRRINDAVNFFVNADVRKGDEIRLLDSGRFMYEGEITKLHFKWNWFYECFELEVSLGGWLVSLTAPRTTIEIVVLNKKKRRSDVHPFVKLKSYKLLDELLTKSTNNFSDKVDTWTKKQGLLPKEYGNSLGKVVFRFIDQYRFLTDDNEMKLYDMVKAECEDKSTEKNFRYYREDLNWCAYMITKYCQ